MTLTLVGMGCGSAATLTEEGRQALLQADLLIGAARLLENLPERCTSRRRAAVRTEEILELLHLEGAQRPCVLFSGDTGIHSGASQLLRRLQEMGGEDIRVLPGISSVQLLAARLGRPWQDWNLCSAHGTDCDPVPAVMDGRPAFFLTGGADGPARLCQAFAEAGLGGLPVTVGERLSYPDERVVCGTAGSFSHRKFDSLSVLLAEAAEPSAVRRTPGFADEAFCGAMFP